MPFYYRKSLSFGPVRFNLSKSGVGVSAGIRGFRIGSGPRGNYVHMGRGGLYYRATLDSPTPPPSSPHYFPRTSGFDHEPFMVEIESGETGNIVDASSRELVDELQRKRRAFPYSPFAAVLGVVGFAILLSKQLHPAFLWTWSALALAGFVVLKILDTNRKTTVIFYELAEDA